MDSTSFHWCRQIQGKGDIQFFMNFEWSAEFRVEFTRASTFLNEKVPSRRPSLVSYRGVMWKAGFVCVPSHSSFLPLDVFVGKLRRILAYFQEAGDRRMVRRKRFERNFSGVNSIIQIETAKMRLCCGLQNYMQF